jgi:hypothetical protein
MSAKARNTRGDHSQLVLQMRRAMHDGIRSVIQEHNRSVPRSVVIAAIAQLCSDHAELLAENDGE